MMFSKSDFHRFISASILAFLAVVSCQQEMEKEDPASDDRILFHVLSDTRSRTKSIADSKAIEMNVGEHTFEMTLTTSDNDNFTDTDNTVQTRGSAYDNTNHQIQKIEVTALIENGAGGNLFFNESVSINNGTGNSERFWPENRLSFFAHACSKENISVEPSYQRQENKCSGQFSYTMPSAAASSPRMDATNQPDIVFAISPDQSKDNGQKVELMFHHALSAVMFKVGNMPDGVFLNSISIAGVYTSGLCEFTSAADGDINFSWSYPNGLKNGRYTEDIMTTAITGEQIGTSEAVFMMIPQQIGSGTKIILSFTLGGKEYQLEKAFNEIISSWEADKKYIFTIGLPSQIDVEVEDAVVGTVKKDVTIQNTGSIPGYIRAAIIGFWVNNKGDVVAPWSEEDGDFVWGSEWSSRWKKGSDGFYYHLAPVGANQFTHPLFETYTLKASTEIGAQHAFQTLELSIITQIITSDDKDLWPELN